MNEPLIILCEDGGGDPVRRFADDGALLGGAVARPECELVGGPGQGLAQRALSRAAELGRAAAALTKAGARLARRR